MPKMGVSAKAVARPPKPRRKEPAPGESADPKDYLASAKDVQDTFFSGKPGELDHNDFEELCEAIETGDDKKLRIFGGSPEEDAMVAKVEAAVWKSKGVHPFNGGKSIKPEKLKGGKTGPGFGPFQRAGTLDDPEKEGLTWVAPTRKYAENFASGGRRVRTFAATVSKPLDLLAIPGNGDVDLEQLSAHLKKNGIDIPAATMGRGGEIHQVFETIAKELREKAMAAGFDCIVQNENYDGMRQTTLVVFTAKTSINSRARLTHEPAQEEKKENKRPPTGD